MLDFHERTKEIRCEKIKGTLYAWWEKIDSLVGERKNALAVNAETCRNILWFALLGLFRVLIKFAPEGPMVRLLKPSTKKLYKATTNYHGKDFSVIWKYSIQNIVVL